MKVCLLGDTHFGVRNDSKIFHAHMEKFYSEVFFPTLRERNIKTIYQLGDLFDRRKYVNFYTLEQCRKYFFDQLLKDDIKMVTLLGNHDIFWREKLTVNSPSLLLENYRTHIEIIDKPIRRHYYDIIPWICKDNEKAISDFIENSKSEYCFGHFEFKGFEMMRGIESHDGMDRSLVSRYKKVFSGHFHTRSDKDNVMYLGTPYELFWSDYNDPKGFYILDDDTHEIEFIQNKDPMFVKFYYDDSKDLDIDVSVVKDKYVKLVVLNKKDFSLFDKVVDGLYNNNPAELKIIEDMSEFEADVDDENLNIEDTLSLLSDYVDAVETNADKDKLKSILKELYVEAHDYAEEK